MRILLLVAGIAIVPKIVGAQQSRLTGTVTDASGGVVPNATVTAIDVKTGISRSGETTDTGAYSIPALVPSAYDVTVSKTGFKSVKFSGIILTIDQILTLDAKLEISTVLQTIEVSGNQVAPIDTETAQISNVVDSTQMKALPLILRDPYQLVLLSPGTIESNTRFGGFSVNGQREMNNNFLIDGIDNNDTDVPGGPSGLQALNPDPTQEFRVITNNYNAEYGRDNGAIVDVKSLSGTNVYHGDALYFGRWNGFGGARHFFNPVGTPMNPYERNLYGRSVGGPIVHDKTFFYANYEGHKWSTTLTNDSLVPDPAFATGIFNYTDFTHPTPVPINVATAMSGNNALPYGLDPTIQKIFGLYQSTYSKGILAPGPDGLRDQLFFPSPDRETDNQGTIRIDHQISKNNLIFGRYLIDEGSQSNPGHSDILPGLLGAVSDSYRTQNFGGGLTSTITPQLVNELRLGGNRNTVPFICEGTSTFDSFGFVDPYGRGADFTFVGPSGTGLTSFGCQGSFDSNGQTRHTGTYQAADNMSWSRGNHTWKWGGEFRDVYSNGFDNFSSRTAFGFDPFFNSVGGCNSCILQGSLPAYITTNPTVIDTIGVLLGVTTSETQSQFFNAAENRVPSDERGFRQKEIGLFIQDSWKLRPNLTLSYGLRWEYFGVPYEASGNFSSLFGQNPQGPAPTNGFEFTTLKQGGAQIWPDNYKGFDPRLGIAWDPFKKGKTSVRAGYGIFRDRIYGNLFENTRANPPFLQSAIGTLPADFSLQGAATIPTVSTSSFVPDQSFFGPTLFDPRFKLPYSQNWNLGIQQEIGSLTVEVNYVGVHGLDLARDVDLNPPQPALIQQLLAFCVASNPANMGFNDSANAQFGTANGQCSPADVTSSNLWVGDFFGTLPDLGPANSGPAVYNRAFADAANNYVTGGVLIRSIAYSHYDGLQLNVTKRYSHGVQIQGAYTWSHALDDSSEPLNPASGNRTFPRNSFNLRPEYGNSDYDVRQRFVMNFVYDPNVGRGKDHLNNGFVGRALQGWELAGIYTVQTGLPYDVFGFVDTQHTGLSDRATLVNPSVLHVAPTNPAPQTQVFTGLNLAAFNPDDPTVMPVPYGIVSNVHRNQFFGPGTNNWDAVLTKTTAITERFRFQLRFEFYNLFNHPAFTQPDNLIADTSTFGYSTSTVTRPDGTTSARQMQVGAKLLF